MITKAGKIPVNNGIRMFFHCSACINERPKGVAPREWSQLEVGFTARGIQVWCKRCELNIIHVDFEGFQHPANMGAK